MPVMEWWEYSEERRETCRLDTDCIMSGREAGDVYISTDIWLLQSQHSKIDLGIRAAMKTASGNGFATARYYDSPAYFFDASASKPFHFKDRVVKEFRISASAGFLCWQTDNGRQNDAVMYGLGLDIKTKRFAFRESFNGYFGWESNCAHDKSIRTGDCPMLLESDIVYHLNKSLEFIFRYQVGLYDYPFRQFRFGIAYKIGIL